MSLSRVSAGSSPSSRLFTRKMYRKMLLLNKREREAAFHDKDTVFAPSSDKVERNSKGLAVVDNLEYKK